MRFFTKLSGLFIILCFVLFQPAKVQATHMMGSDLTWTCIGKDSFLVKLVIYRDCNGVQLSAAPATFKCSSTGATITSVTMSPGAGTDITPVCNSSCTRCQSLSCSFPYGIQRFIMTQLVVLSSAGSCCNIEIYWQQSARNSNITTGAANMNFYIEAKMNRCQNPCDNSPSFTNAPIAILCVNQDFTFNHGVQDIDVNSQGGLADSLTYEWTPPLRAANSPCTYVGQYSYDKAIYFWGFPNANLPFPRGIHLDQQTGDIQFRPMKAEVTVMAIKVNEYRNGVKIAEIRRDMQIIVINCVANNPPNVTTPGNIRSKSVCAGDPVTFNFTTSDPNTNDTVTISWNQAIPGALWTSTNGAAKYPTATLTWTPTDAHVSSLPYTFTVTAKDNACPVRASFTQAYQITVKPKPRAKIIVVDSGCGLYYFMAQRIEGSGPSYMWIGSSFTFTPNIGPIVHHKFQPGKFPYSMTMTASGCSNTYFDTIEVDTFLTNSLPKDMNVCFGTPVTLNSTVKHAKGPVTMTWGSKASVFPLDKGRSKNLVVIRDTAIWSNAKDSIGCTETDTIHINMHNMPVVNLGPDVRICNYSFATLKPVYSLDEGIKKQISWKELRTNTNQGTDSQLVVSDSGIFVCTVMDTLGCIGSDTQRVLVNPDITAGASGKVVCYGEEAELEGLPTGGGAAQYVWYEGTKLVGAARKVKVKPLVTTNYTMKVSETTGGVTCKDSITVKVIVNPLPVIKINPIPGKCINGTMISLNNYVTVDGSFKAGGIWSSPSNGLVFGDKFNPLAAGVSSPPGWKVRYEYTDPTSNCYNKDSGYITIWALPKPYAGLDDTMCTADGKRSLSGTPMAPPGDWRGPGVGGTYMNWYFDPVAGGIVNGGSYNLIYHYKDNNGCENEDTARITVYRTPVVDAGQDKEVCEDAGPVTLVGNPAGGSWSGTGVVGGQFYPSISKTGIFDMTYTYTNVVCTVSDKMKITVWSLPVLSVGTKNGNRRIFCRNDGLIELDGQPAGGTWSGSGVQGNYFNTAIGADVQSDYTMTYRYVDAHGCVSTKDLTLTVKPEPVVVIDPTANKLCFGNPYTIKATYNHADGVQWSNGMGNDGVIVGRTDSTEISYNPGVNDLSRLYFWLKIQTTHKTTICQPAYDSIMVKMSAMPVPDLLGIPRTGCVPLIVQFKDSSSIATGSITQWRWNFGDGQTSVNQNPQHEYTRPGKYSISLKAISDAGCEKEITKTDYIETYPVPDALFIANPELALLSVPTISFENRTLNETSLTKYSWNFDDWPVYEPTGGTSTEKNPVYKYSDTGTYHVMLWSENEWGCRDSLMRPVIIMPDVTVFVPNAFKPSSNEQKNNVFRAVAGGISTFQIQVYDRWGMLMYESNDYPTHGWPGTYLDTGDFAPLGAYIYVVRVKGLDGIDYKYSGTVTLLR